MRLLCNKNPHPNENLLKIYRRERAAILFKCGSSNSLRHFAREYKVSAFCIQISIPASLNENFHPNGKTFFLRGVVKRHLRNRQAPPAECSFPLSLLLGRRACGTSCRSIFLFIASRIHLFPTFFYPIVNFATF